MTSSTVVGTMAQSGYRQGEPTSRYPHVANGPCGPFASAENLARASNRLGEGAFGENLGEVGLVFH